MYSDGPSIIIHLFGVIALIGSGQCNFYFFIFLFIFLFIFFNIQSENQALLSQGMRNFCIYYFELVVK